MTLTSPGTRGGWTLELVAFWYLQVVLGMCGGEEVKESTVDSTDGDELLLCAKPPTLEELTFKYGNKGHV